MNEKITLDINPETVSHIANLAREFYGGEQMPDAEPGVDAAEEWEAETEALPEGNPIYTEFECVIRDLEPDQQVQLVALMWLGRGSFPDWQSALDEARESWTPKTADYLAGTPLLSDYLEEGLNSLGYFSEDLEV